MASEPRALALACALVALAAAPPALAEPGPAEKEMARNLMDEGDRKLDARDYTGALEAYQLADSIMGVPSTGIDVARTQLTLGRLVEAWETAVKVTKLPRKPGEREAFTRARREADALADQLAPRIPTLRVSVEGAPAGSTLETKLDGEPVPAASLLEGRKVNPGRHVVIVASRGYTTATASTSLAERQSAALLLSLSPAPEHAPAPEGSSLSPLVPIGFSVAGAGIVAGSITGILSLTATASARTHCSDNRCPPSLAGDLDRARILANVSNAGFALGLAGAVIGVVGVVISGKHPPRAAPPSASISAAPIAGGGVAGLTLRF